MSVAINLQTQSTEWLLKSIRLAQECQKLHGQRHPLWAVWSATINACCAEMERREDDEPSLYRPEGAILYNGHRDSGSIIRGARTMS